MTCCKVVVAILIFISLTGCVVRRHVVFRDGTTMLVEIHGSHHALLGTSGKIVFRNSASNEVVVVGAEICDADLTATLIEHEADNYSSAKEYIGAIKQEGWEWR